MHPTFPQGAGAQTFRLKGVKNFADVLCTVYMPQSSFMVFSSPETVHGKRESCIAIHFALVNGYMILSFGTF